MGVVCAIHGCLSSEHDKNRRKFYRFPRDEVRSRAWIRASGRDDLEDITDYILLHKRYRVCDLHFVPSDFFKNRGIKFNAVPTLNLPQLEYDDTLSKHTQTHEESDCCSDCASGSKIITPSKSRVYNVSIQTGEELHNDTSRKRKLSNQLTHQSKWLKTLEDQSQASEKDDFKLSSVVQKIIKVQKYYKSNVSGYRFDRNYITFAMKIYFASPLAYRILAKTLCLPSERTLRRKSIDIGTSFSENIIRCLQYKVKKLSESEKICVVAANAMPLKRHLHYQINRDKIIGFHEINDIQKREPATQAFVVMARGLFSKWEQPLAYCFLSESKNYTELNKWLDDIIKKVLDIGFNVVAFNSVETSCFIDMARSKHVTAAEPYFHINGKNIYYIYDVPHLLKSLRNNLLKHDFVYHDSEEIEQTVSWEVVQNLYKIEKEKRYQMVFKLTESHIKPNKFEKREVKFAAQIFSRSVATAIMFNVELGKLPKKALGTAKFIQLINDMFDILNSSSCNDTYKYKKPFFQQEYQMEVLQKILHFLRDVRIVDKVTSKNVTNSLKCLKSLEITIRSVIHLSTDLRCLSAFISARKLNQDVLQKFFAAIRQQGGKFRKPTPHKVADAFRNFFLENIVTRSNFANCAEDIDQLLAAVEESSNTVQLPENKSQDFNILNVGTVDYRFDLPEENAFGYVCDYLLRKCKEVHNNCTSMVEYITYEGEIDVANNVINMTSSDTSQGFKDFIKKLDEVVMKIFGRTDKLPLHVGTEIIRNVEKIVLTNSPCECYPIEYLKKLFIRLRIFNVIKYNNLNYKNKSVQKNILIVSQLF